MSDETNPHSAGQPDSPQSLLRRLPGVDVLIDATCSSLPADAPRGLVAIACRSVIDQCRKQLLDGGTIDESQLAIDAMVGQVRTELDRMQRPPLASVINATGILLHTGLGRSPLAASVVQAINDVAGGYAPVEIDMESGRRNKRSDLIRPLLCQLTGCQSATAVNNNAAATMLSLAAVAEGREVIVSRGELVEIGGSFRLPDVMKTANVRLCEVGTTNRTRLADYANAISLNTAAIMKVHTSNYRVVGFTESVSIESLVALGRDRNLPVIDDIGSGALRSMAAYGFEDEPWAGQSIQAGADLALFSGDKLLNGPQAGIIVGRSEWIERIESHPLYRVFRIDKITMAALAKTLSIHLDPQQAQRELPVYRMLTTTLDTLRQRAGQLVERLQSVAGRVSIHVIDSQAYLGGGSMPTQSLPSIALQLDTGDDRAHELSAALRQATAPILARVHQGAVLIDLRTVMPAQFDALVVTIKKALEPWRNR